MSSDHRFEEPLERLRSRIDSLRESPGSPARDKAIRKISDKLVKLSGEIYANLTPWQKTLVARHPARPFTLDYVRVLLRDFVELRGDRAFADDPAIVAGFGVLGGRTVAVVGHQKGRDTKEKVRRNFGMPRPEGYRKALRVMKLAEKFHRPVLTFIDTPGAYPGVESEERGVSEAIAVNLLEMARLREAMVRPLVLDGRNLYEPGRMAALGFEYYGAGRPHAEPALAPLEPSPPRSNGTHSASARAEA